MQAGVERSLNGVRVRDAMDPNPPAVSPNETVADLVNERMLGGEDRSYLVRHEDGGLAGIVTLKDVSRLARDDWPVAARDRHHDPLRRPGHDRPRRADGRRAAPDPGAASSRSCRWSSPTAGAARHGHPARDPEAHQRAHEADWLTGPMLPLEEAQARLLAHARSVGEERVALADAVGRVLADPRIVAAVDVPPFANSSMDGFALHAADAPGVLRVAGEIAAGVATLPSVEAGTAVRIMTGAPLPPGADAVVPIEDADRVRRRRLRARRPSRPERSSARPRTTPEPETRSAGPVRSRRPGWPCSPPWASARSTSAGVRSSRSCRPATSSSPRATRCGPGRSTTRTARRWRPR